MKRRAWYLIAISCALVIILCLTGRMPMWSHVPMVTATPSLISFPASREAVELNTSRSTHNSLLYEKVAEIAINTVSGIVFHPQRKTLFAVSDEGGITEIETDGTLVRQGQPREGADFEGITCDPATGRLYVAVEGDDTILEIDPETLRIIRDIPIDRVFGSRILLDPKGNGIEGITFVPASTDATDDTFYLVNQSDNLEGRDPSIILQVEVGGSVDRPEAKIIRYFSLGVTDLSGIHYDPSEHQLLVVSDNNDLLMRVNLAGQISHTYPLLGVHQEGIALDEDGFLYIAQDSKKEGVLKFQPDGFPLVR